MTNKILCGPRNNFLPSEPFVQHFFKKLQNQEPTTILLVDAETEEYLTNKQILDYSKKLAWALKNCGINQDDTICIISENNVERIVPILGTFYIGATVNMLNPTYSIPELKHSLSQSESRIIFCSENALDNVLQLKKQFSFIEQVVLIGKATGKVTNLKAFMEDGYSSNTEFEPDIIRSPEQVALLLSSSGTTGPPKGVMITYEALRHCLIYSEKNYLNVDHNTVISTVVPFYHAFGCYTQLFGMFASCKLIVMKTFQPDKFLKSIEKYGITKLFIVPTLATFLAKSPLVNKYNITSVNDIMCTSSVLPQDIYDMMEKRFQLRMRQLYGLTESGVVTVTTPESVRVSNAVGFLMPDMFAKIRNPENLETLGPHESGEICLKGPSVMKGYVNNPEANEAAFDEQGFFLTGDLGYYDEGGCFYIVDRLKELIKYKGFQVAPIDLENILMTHTAVKEVAVIGVPDERAGELPMAVVVKQLNSDVTERDLCHFVSEQTSVNKRLYGGVKFVEVLPKNQTGKILKRVLREIFTK